MLCFHWKWSPVLLFIWSFSFCLEEQACMTFWNFVHFKNSALPKTFFQLHDHSIDWLSSSTSIYLKCSCNYFYRRCKILKKTSFRLHLFRPSESKDWLLSFIIHNLFSLWKECYIENYVILLKKLKFSNKLKKESLGSLSILC